jgi:hypothetical protein
VPIDGVAGASSAVPREDSTAFSTQLEGTLRNLRDRRYVTFLGANFVSRWCLQPRAL